MLRQTLLVLLSILLSSSIFSQSLLKIGEPAPALEVDEWLGEAPKERLGSRRPLIFYIAQEPSDRPFYPITMGFSQLEPAYRGAFDFAVLHDTRTWEQIQKNNGGKAQEEQVTKEWRAKAASSTMTAYDAYHPGTLFLIDQKGRLQWYGSEEDLRVAVLNDFLRSGKAALPAFRQPVSNPKYKPRRWRDIKYEYIKIEWTKVNSKERPKTVMYASGIDYYNMTFAEIMETQGLMKELFMNFNAEGYTDTTRYHLAISDAEGYIPLLAFKGYLFNQDFQNLIFESIKANIPFSLAVKARPLYFHDLYFESKGNKLNKYLVKKENLQENPPDWFQRNDSLVFQQAEYAAFVPALGQTFPDHLFLVRKYPMLNLISNRYTFSIPVKTPEQTLNYLYQELGIRSGSAKDTAWLYLWHTQVPDHLTKINTEGKSYFEIMSERPGKVREATPPQQGILFEKALSMNGASLTFEVNKWISQKQHYFLPETPDAKLPLILTFVDPDNVNSKCRFSALEGLSTHCNKKAAFIIIDVGDSSEEDFKKKTSDDVPNGGHSFRSQSPKGRNYDESDLSRSNKAPIFFTQDIAYPWMEYFKNQGSSSPTGQTFVFNQQGELSWQGDARNLRLRTLDEIIKTGRSSLSPEVEESRYNSTLAFNCGDQPDRTFLRPKVIIENIPAIDRKQKKQIWGQYNSLEYYGFTIKEIIDDLMPVLRGYPLGGITIQEEFGEEQVYVLVKDHKNAKEALLEELINRYQMNVTMDSVLIDSWVMSVADTDLLQAHMGTHAGKAQYPSKSSFVCLGCGLKDLSHAWKKITGKQTIVELPRANYEFMLNTKGLEELKNRLQNEVGIKLKQEKRYWPILNVVQKSGGKVFNFYKTVNRYADEIHNYAGRSKEENATLRSNLSDTKDCQIQIGDKGSKIVRKQQQRREQNRRFDVRYFEQPLLNILCPLKGWSLPRVSMQEGLDNPELEVVAVCNQMNNKEVQTAIVDKLLDRYQLRYKESIANRKVYVLEITDELRFRRAIDQDPGQRRERERGKNTMRNLKGEDFLYQLERASGQIIVCDTPLEERYQFKLTRNANFNTIRKELEQQYSIVLVEETREIPVIEILPK
ncbi:MAG: DUF3738 domain-containing protein [Bacteroidota bacterium]